MSANVRELGLLHNGQVPTRAANHRMSATDRERVLRAGLSPGKKSPSLESERHAAVAIILADATLEMLFIRRPTHPRDPWSGQVALPGGRHEATDAHLEATARRETAEEVGIVLAEEHWWGALSPVQANARLNISPVWVTPQVYRIPGPAPNFQLKRDEAEAARWISLEDLLDPAHETNVHVRRDGTSLRLPGWQIDDFTIWGLTYFMVRAFLRPVMETARHQP